MLKDSTRSVDALEQYLDNKGFQCKTLFGSLPTQHKAFDFLGYVEGDFPVSERIGRTGLHFGVHQYLTDDDIQYAAETVNAFFQ